MRIQATMGTVIEKAMPDWWSSDGNAMTPGIAMKTIMPTSMAIHISAKWRAKRAAITEPAEIRDDHVRVVVCEERMCDMRWSVAVRDRRAIQQQADQRLTSSGFG